ncbi:MAG: 50S ribosomal protein L15 [Kiritimatiellae bacterium]|nr:50S ribosomal protein L15 [Kiritimatiellia bacterium]MDD5522246.1 50S ribosomal protein L15 [Kiritimatiellia bacterium]
MDLTSLKNTPGARHRRMRVGRGGGSGKGKTCGRGHKGQMARKGHKHKSGFEGGQMKLIRRIPKRGFKSMELLGYLAVNLADLEKFDEGTEITESVLKASGLAKGIHKGVKILGNGEINKKLTVKVHAFSASAKAKIEKAGGVCEVVTA